MILKFQFIDKPSATSSLSEIKAEEIIKEEDPTRLIEYTKKFLIKVYPAFFRQDSSNLNPLDYWIYGMQIG
jgi:hypothetical protein